jgi:hypothetical protein
MAQKLNAIKDFFNNFDSHYCDSKNVLKSVERGVNDRKVRNYLVRKKPSPKQTRPGLVPSDPIILDAAEVAPEYSTPQPTKKEASDYSPVRSSSRRKPRKNLNGMVMWGDIEYRQQTFDGFRRTWNTTQTMWKTIDQLRAPLGADSEFREALTQFKTAMERISDRTGASPTTVFALGRCWKMVEKKLLGREAVWGKFWEFSQTFHELTEQAALYECILAYPDSRDRRKRRKGTVTEV